MTSKAAVRLLATMSDKWSSVQVEGTDPMAVAIALQGIIPLRNWAIDLDRRINQVEAAIAEADSLGPPKGLEGLESALWRLSAALNSLKALCFLALGVPTVEPGFVFQNGRPVKGNPPVRTSVQWQLHGQSLGDKLVELAPAYPVAAELNRLLVTLDEHAAITLRDEITHSLAPITRAPELCLLRVTDVDGSQLKPLRVGPRQSPASPRRSSGLMRSVRFGTHLDCS